MTKGSREIIKLAALQAEHPEVLPSRHQGPAIVEFYYQFCIRVIFHRWLHSLALRVGVDKMSKSQTTKIAEILCLVGGLLGLLYGILQILGMGLALLPGLGLGGLLGGLISGIILLVLSLVVLATSGVVDIPALKMEKNWIIMLILGILLYVFGGGLPGILVIVGAILMLL